MRLALPCLSVVVLLALPGCEKKEPAPEAKTPAVAADNTADVRPAASTVAIEDLSVEVGCGKCIYHMPGVQGCEVAAVVNGTPMLVKGSGVDAHAHGLCGSSKTATVSGEVKDGAFVATSVSVE
ncbi:MAG: DUF6370 family protein [Planctomycetota bacterium]|jgi:hypothetical protein